MSHQHGIAVPWTIPARTAKQDRGGWQLSSAAVRDRHLRRRGVRKENFYGVWYGTIVEVPVNDTESGYAYPARVRLSVFSRTTCSSYEQAADFSEFHQFRFGMPSTRVWNLSEGQQAVTFWQTTAAQDADKTTLHRQNRIQTNVSLKEEMAAISDRLIVMSQLSSQFLQEIFKVPGSKIDMVPSPAWHPRFALPGSQFLQGPLWGGRKITDTTYVRPALPNKGIENIKSPSVRRS